MTAHRRTAALALLAVVALTGCSQTNPVTTDREYSAADGVRVSLGDLRATNLLVVAAEKGGPGIVSGGVTNDGDTDTTVTLSVGDESGTTLDVPAGGAVLFGTGSDTGESIEVAAVPAAPGALATVTLSSPEAGSTTVQVPVLDGTLPEYAPLLPTASS